FYIHAYVQNVRFARVYWARAFVFGGQKLDKRGKSGTDGKLCTFATSSAYKYKGVFMTDTYLDDCVSLPNKLLDGLLAYRLTGVQLRTILWVLRNSAGVSREAAPFSWYQIARELGLDRAGVFRAGTRLIAAKILWLRDGVLGIQYDPAL